MATLWYYGNTVGHLEDWNWPANWGTTRGAHDGWVPTINDDAILDIAYPCTITAAAFCKSLTITSVFSTKIFTQSYPLNVAGTVDFSNARAVLYLDSVITITADGDFWIGPNISTFIRLGYGSLICQGTGTLRYDYAVAKYWNTLSLAAAGKTTTIYNAKYWAALNVTIGSGTLTLNGQLNCYYYGTSTSVPTLTVDPSATINGTSVLFFGQGQNLSMTLSVPALTMTGTTTFWCARGREGTPYAGTVTVNLMGNIRAPTIKITNDKPNPSSFIFNMNGYNIYADTSLSIGGSVASSTMYFNARYDVWQYITCGSFLNTYNLGVKNFDFGSSQWTCYGNWTTGSTAVVTVGYMLLLFYNSGVLDTSGKNLYYVYFDYGSCTITTGTSTWNRVHFSPGYTYTFTTTNNLTISSFSAGDWSGTAGNLVTLQSSSAGIEHHFQILTTATVSYVYVKDTHSDGGVYVIATDGTSTRGSNVLGWSWPIYDGGVLKRWTGSAWVRAKLKTYMGSWVSKPLKWWGGSSWKVVDITG